MTPALTQLCQQEPLSVLSSKRSRRDFLRIGAALALGVKPSAFTFAQDRSPPKTGFVPPTAEVRRKAIGLDGITPATLRRSFEPNEDFGAITAPEPGDWLAKHRETGQTVAQFLSSKPNKPNRQRSKIYFVPFGDFDPEWSPKLADLEACAAAFFQINVKTLPARSLDDNRFTTRENQGKQQYLTGDLIQQLTTLLPNDGYAILGITMQDLYPGPSWNFVFGQASPRNRAGIYSFARYDPLFFDEQRTAEAKELLFIRSLGVLLHETCHMFGMAHCIYFSCLMNGANNLEESDRTPLHLCPVCLRKLHLSVGFEITSRYEDLLKEYRQLNVEDEVKWLEKRLKFLRNP